MNKINNLYLDDYSAEDIIDLLKLAKINNNSDTNSEEDNINSEDNSEDDKNNSSNSMSNNKPSFTIKPHFNSKGEKIVIFSINIPLPLKKNGLKIDILINDEMYKNIGRHLK